MSTASAGARRTARLGRLASVSLAILGPLTSWCAIAVAAPPSEVALRNAAACSGCLVSPSRKLALPFTNVEAYSAKVIKADGSGAAVVTLLGDGSKASERALLKAEADARKARLGITTGALARRLAVTADAQLLDVAIWSKASISPLRRETLAASAASRAEQAAETGTRLQAAAAPAVSWLRARGFPVQEDGSRSPLIRARLPAGAVRALAARPDLAGLIDVTGPGAPTTAAWYPTEQIDLARVRTKAASSKGCAFEACQPSDTTFLRIGGVAVPAGCATGHMQAVLGIMSNTFANNTSITDGTTYAADWSAWNSPDGATNTVEWCTLHGATVLNHSWSFAGPDSEGQVKANNDMQQDFYALISPWPLFVDAAGNDSADGYVEQLGFNTLVVGASDDKGTVSATTSDDTIASFSSWKNPITAHDDRELPYIVASGVNVDSANLTGLFGTSFAAPQASGVAMMIDAVDPALRFWPEAKRAMFLATTLQRVDGQPFSQLGPSMPDRKDGTGRLNGNKAAILAAHGKFYHGVRTSVGRSHASLSMNPDSEGSFVAASYLITIPSGKQLRAALAWTATPANCQSDGSNCGFDVLDADLDLLLIDAHGRLVKSSTAFDSSWEALSYKVPGNYTLKILVGAFPATTLTHYGIAWYSH